MKLYKAVDKVDGDMSAFLVYDNRKVAVSYWGELPDADKVEIVKIAASDYLREPAERFNDAVDPVLIAEW
ncbi:hypothetical protein KSS88_18360 [Bacillus altitudinis]|nr:hypothetical protein [Bacillus altitudinis]MBU8970810.1 hypothetical protein [Bacillus altitudinis]